MSEYVRRLPARSRPLPAARLAQIDMELTERCNNDCIHCCINLPANHPNRAREMSTGQVMDILKQAAGLGCLDVRFTGGEPLLRPDFEELYLFARRLGLQVLLFTNARLITPRLADLLARIPPLVEIEITVYGMHAESYERVSRVPGSFAQFWRGVELLLQRDVPFVVKFAVLPPNKHELDEFEAWADTIPWMISRPNYAVFFDLRNRRDDEEKNRGIRSLRLTGEEGLGILSRDKAAFRRHANEFAAVFLGPSDDTLFACGASTGGTLCVDAYGRAQPCLGIRVPELTQSVVGSLEPMPLEDVLTEFAGLGKLRATNPEFLRRCGVCFLRELCEQCPAKSWAEHGTLDTPVEYLCDIAHQEARLLGWLGENEHGWDDVPWRERMDKLLHTGG